MATLQTETKSDAEQPTAADIEETKAFLDAHQPPSEVERAAARFKERERALGRTPGSPKQASGWITSADWRYWTQIGELELWQAVALTFGVDPLHALKTAGKVERIEFSSESERLEPDRFQKFQRRLKIAESHLGGDLKVAQLVADQDGRRFHSRLWLCDFAKWAVTMNLAENLPSELTSPTLEARASDGPIPGPETMEIRLLRELRAHCMKHYNPQDSSSWPTVEANVQWLQKMHGISKGKAELVAKMAHRDDLPRGPRRDSAE